MAVTLSAMLNKGWASVSYLLENSKDFTLNKKSLDDWYDFLEQAAMITSVDVSSTEIVISYMIIASAARQKFLKNIL